MTPAIPPSVRRYAAARGIDPEALAARTGRAHISRDDIDAALSPAPAAPAGPDPLRAWRVDPGRFGPVRRVPRTRLAQVAAQALSAAQSLIPQVTQFDRADLRELDALRAALAPEAAARGLRLTPLAFHVAALARGLRAAPTFNAMLDPSGTELILRDYVHIGIAVDTPHGLVVPVLRDADRKGLWQIAADLADLSGRARARRLAPDEMAGASMTISSLGARGGTGFTPIVNPPEVAILGLARADLAPVWTGTAFVPAPMLPLCLSYDHRVIDGAAAAAFLGDHAALISDPRRLLL